MEQFIKEVNNWAYRSAKNGNDPFAALLVKNGRIVASSIDLSVVTSDPMYFLHIHNRANCFAFLTALLKEL